MATYPSLRVRWSIRGEITRPDPSSSLLLGSFMSRAFSLSTSLELLFTNRNLPTSTLQHRPHPLPRRALQPNRRRLHPPGRPHHSLHPAPARGHRLRRQRPQPGHLHARIRRERPARKPRAERQDAGVRLLRRDLRPGDQERDAGAGRGHGWRHGAIRGIREAGWRRGGLEDEEEAGG
jgi:hypothetical protein